MFLLLLLLLRGTTIVGIVSSGRTIQETLPDDDAVARIVGGRPARVGDFPSFVWTAGSQLCGGSIIWPDLVLTAAHCHGAFDNGILYNGINFNGGVAGELFQPVDVEYPHPDYNTTVRDANDLMLVKTSSSVAADDWQQLNWDPDFPPDGAVATVLGYGRANETGGLSNILLQTDVPIVDFATCNGIFGRIVDQVMICAGGIGGMSWLTDGLTD